MKELLRMYEQNSFTFLRLFEISLNFDPGVRWELELAFMDQFHRPRRFVRFYYPRKQALGAFNYYKNKLKKHTSPAELKKKLIEKTINDSLSWEYNWGL